LAKREIRRKSKRNRGTSAAASKTTAPKKESPLEMLTMSKYSAILVMMIGF